MTNELKRFQAVPGYSPASSKLIDFLKVGKPGDRVTDDKLTEVSDADCSDAKGRAYVLTAARYVLKHYSIVWQREVGQGAIRCLDPSERVEAATNFRHRAGRVVTKAIQTVPALDDVEPDKRPEVLALAATLGTMRQFSKAETQNKLLKEGVTSTADMKKLLESFPR